MKQRKWHKGPPPHVGWWEASFMQHPDYWRWWNGTCWSSWAHVSHSSIIAAHWATFKTDGSGVEWTDYYPKNARVPRIDPRKKGTK